MAKKAQQQKSIHELAVKTDSRTCFGIAYFKTEEEAMEIDKRVRAEKQQYNGGWFHGMACGRDKSFDYVDKDLGKLYAVTYA